MRCSFCALALVAIVGTGAGCASARARGPTPLARFTLVAAQTWRLNLPEPGPFDASGLLRTPSGDLLVVNDHRPNVYRVEFRADADSADLVRLTNWFTVEQLGRLAAQKTRPFDWEGLAHDEV